jgi:hypothetical protein
VPPGDRDADACGDFALGIGHAQEV